MRLYDLTEQYETLLEMLESDADNDALKLMLDGLEGKIEDKIDNCLCLRNARRAEAKAIKEEAQRLAQRAQQCENEAKRLEDLVEDSLIRLGVEKIKTMRFTAWMQNNPESVEVVEQTHIPSEFWRQSEPVLDKAMIKERLKENYPIPGVQLRQTKSLRVR